MASPLASVVWGGYHTNMRTLPIDPGTIIPGAIAAGGSAAPTSPALDDLTAAVERFLGSDAPRSDAEVGSDLLAVGVLIERLEAARVGLLARLDRSGAYLADGAVSPAAWLRARTGMGHGAARDRVALGRSLSEMPSTTEAFARGEISFAHARVLAAAVAPGADPDAREHFLAAEPAFVDAARVTTPQELRKIIERYVLDLAGDDGVARAEELHARRRFHASPTFEGMVAGSFLLDPESGEILLTALAARTSTDPDDPEQPPRSPAQRRADALTDVMRDFLDSGAPVTTGGERPHVTLVVDLATLTGHNPDSADHTPHPDDCPTCSPRASHSPDSAPDSAGPSRDGAASPNADGPITRSKTGSEPGGETPAARGPQRHRPADSEPGGDPPRGSEPKRHRPADSEPGGDPTAEGEPNGHCPTDSEPGGALHGSRGRRLPYPCDLSGSALLEQMRTDLPSPESMLRYSPGTIERRCDLDYLGPIGAETARRIACDSGISRIVVAGSSEPLDVGRRTRTIPPAIRRAVVYRDRHCQYPGCDQHARSATCITATNGGPITAAPTRSDSSCSVAATTGWSMKADSASAETTWA